jgi:hypothetical protein
MCGHSNRALIALFLLLASQISCDLPSCPISVPQWDNQFHRASADGFHQSRDKVSGTEKVRGTHQLNVKCVSGVLEGD